MFWNWIKDRKQKYSSEITCCQAFEEALARAEHAIEDAKTPTPQELHIGWQREQQGKHPIRDDSRFLADLLDIPYTTDREIYAKFALKNLWKQRTEFKSERSDTVTGILEPRKKGRYFDHGDSPFVECQIRLNDGTVRFTAIDVMDRRLYGKQVSGRVTGVAFVQDEQSKRRNPNPYGTPRTIYTGSYEPPKEEKLPVDDRPFKPWKGRAHSYTRR